MASFCVDGATVAIIGSPQTLTTATASLSALGQSIFKLNSKAVLTKDDIDTWASSYTSAYTSGSFTGNVTVQKANISGLASKTTYQAGSVLVLNTTSITLTLVATGTDPSNGTPDPVTSGTATVTFTNPGQTLGSSV